MISKRIALAASVLLCCLCIAAPCRAATLTELFAGASITADDKRFSDWTLIARNVVNGATVNLDQINVTPLTDDPLNPGIQFTAPVGALGTPFGHVGPSLAQLVFSFTVQTTNQMPLIVDNSLLIDNFTFDAGPGASIKIAEAVTDANNVPLAAKLATARPDELPGMGNPNHFDVKIFPSPQSFVRVVKAIDIDGPGTNDGAFLTGFEQRFSQVPEPASVALISALLLWGIKRPMARRSLN